MIKIGRVLQDSGLVSAKDVDEALKIQKKNGKFLGDILVQMGRISQQDLLRCLSQQMKISFISLKETEISPEAVKRMPVKFVWHYKIMPVNFQAGLLTVAVSDPLNMWPLDDVKLHLGVEIEPVLAASADIDEAIHKYYGVGADTIEKILSKEEEKKKTPVITKHKVEDIEKLAGDASTVSLVNQILKEAIEARATDVHFELYEKELMVRYRVDGVLRPVKVSDDIQYLYSAIVARIKIITGLDIVERRMPQSGGSRIRLAGHEYDLRVSIIPDNYGEGVVIRILPMEMLINLEHLGMTSDELKILKKLIQSPNGLIYITGPTGSGKTTTLYACLSRLNKPDVKIITVEDPVEYKMHAVEQIQINSKVGLSFAQVLRSVLRHDPDIIMVGEVRDKETAEIAVQASLTGHLVLSTLHTNSAASAVTRLLDMGVEPYLVSSTIRGLIAQRLVRKICEHCKKKVEWNPEIMPEHLREQARKLSKITRGAGCEKCRHTGYMGRAAIYEILTFSESLRGLAVKRASAAEIEKQASEEGMKTLLQSGWAKVCAGITTPEEVMRVVQNGA